MDEMQKHWSRFQSAGQDGFADTKEDLVDEIREWVRKRDRCAEMKTLERMSKHDLAMLMHVLRDA
jgi:hypothetical protein